MYRRLLLSAVLGLSLSACVPYYGGGGTYYRSEVYTAPAPAYYYGGPGYVYGRSYYAPSPRYYPAPRYYQPGPRYYSRPGYRPYPNQGWDSRWGNGGGHNGGSGHGGHR
ncbi:hypothetical protein ACW9H6_20415 [Pseudomonas sp. SDO528_S397]